MSATPEADRLAAMSDAELIEGAVAADAVQLDMIRDLQRRLAWLERQHRMLVTTMAFYPVPIRPAICVDSRCGWGPVPHMAEQPDLCPWLKHTDPHEAAEQCSST